MYQPLYGPKGLVIFDHPYIADYALIHPDSIWEERHARIIFYERDALVMPFADFLGDGGRQLPISGRGGAFIIVGGSALRECQDSVRPGPACWRGWR